MLYRPVRKVRAWPANRPSPRESLREPHVSAAAASETRSPFIRLTELLAGLAPGLPAINLSVGEPQHAVPAFVGPILSSNLTDFNKYPAGKGTESFRIAVADWLGRRYGLPRPIDPESEVLVLAGTREGLFLAGTVAARRAAKSHPAILVPNPFYPAYGASADVAGCELVPMPARADLPDLDALPATLLDRTVALYLASPANPQGSVADAAYLGRLVGLARQHRFMLFADECYSELWDKTPPPGILEVAGPDRANVVAFHSLSKRSNLAGLRCGFCAGDAGFLQAFLDLRNVAAPQIPLPVQAVAVAAYADETHVEENRALYRAKYDLADQILGDRFGYRRPPGGFFIWLDVAAHGGSVAVTKRLWTQAGLRVVPGAYLARTMPDGTHPGDAFIRLAMVHDKTQIGEALHRLVSTLDRPDA
jgi:aspartate/methionine/tyrosine aminotransferase